LRNLCAAAMLILALFSTLEGCSGNSQLMPATALSKQASNGSPSPARTSSSIVPEDTCPGCGAGECTTWYQEVNSGTMDPSVDIVLGTTCDNAGDAAYPGTFTGTCGPTCFMSYTPPPSCTNSCVSYSGSPKDGQKCAGSQFAIGDPIVPANNNSAKAAYYVNNISNIWQNGVVVAVEYQATTPAGGSTPYFFMQETNNGASVNFGASIGVSFGPVNVGVSGGETYNMVSPITWFYPGQTPVPKNAVDASCWPAKPMPS